MKARALAAAGGLACLLGAGCAAIPGSVAPASAGRDSGREPGRAWIPEAACRLQALEPHVGQALVVLAEPAPGFRAGLSSWERRGGAWRAVFPSMPAVIGRNGLAPAGTKAEGDGRTPSGVYRLGTAFGDEAVVPTNLAYRQATENDFWVDDPQSPQYNQWVSGIPQARSFERMKRDDDFYRLGIVIDYNTAPVVPGKGSAIFLHVWAGPDVPTSGCVALAREDVIRLLGWLDRAQHPVIVLEPRIPHARAAVGAGPWTGALPGRLDGVSARGGARDAHKRAGLARSSHRVMGNSGQHGACANPEVMAVSEEIE
ncbi:MAG: L,D-transpeptidase family protein [Verrucomicrobia bacterium]|nr:L,D-transpeptidase family protein [Verrucomicrobiota bacterium]